MTPEELALLHGMSFTRPRPWTAAEFRDILASPHVFLVTEDGGFALGRAVAGEAELLTIAVPAVLRRTGIGRRLMAGFDHAARARGVAEIFLEVAEDNPAAIALYRAAGFSEAGRRKGYYRDATGTVDALAFRKVMFS